MKAVKAQNFTALQETSPKSLLSKEAILLSFTFNHKPDMPSVIATLTTSLLKVSLKK